MTCAYRAHRVRSRLATPIVLRPVVALSRSLCCCYGWCEALVTCPTVPLVLSFNNFSRMHKKWTNFSINCYQKQFKYFIARQTGDSGRNRCENKSTKWKTYCGATREVRSTTAQYPVSLLRCLSFYFFFVYIFYEVIALHWASHTLREFLIRSLQHTRFKHTLYTRHKSKTTF